MPDSLETIEAAFRYHCRHRDPGRRQSLGTPARRIPRSSGAPTRLRWRTQQRSSRGSCRGAGRAGAAAGRTEGVARGARGVAAALRAARDPAARLRRGGRARRGAYGALDRALGDRAGGVRVPASRRGAQHGEPAPLRRRHRSHGGLRLRAGLASCRRWASTIRGCRKAPRSKNCSRGTTRRGLRWV